MQRGPGISRFGVLGLVVLAGFLCVPAWADWNPGDPYKMHFPQLPNPTGWDIEISSTTNQHEVADDWACTETGPVSDIHFWVSWQGDCAQYGGPDVCLRNITNIAVTIYDDVPAGGVTNYSHPGNVLWTRTFQPGQFTFREYGTGDEGFADPQYFPTGWSQGVDHVLHQQINIENIASPYVQQQGHIYWLGIYLWWNGTQPPAGWKTTYVNSHFQDYAVFRPLTGAMWQPLVTPGGFPWPPPWNQGLDMAFVITTSQDATKYKADWPNYAPSGMPDFEQQHAFAMNPVLTAQTACGPTAMLDSLWWFDSELDCDTHRTAGDAAESEPNPTCSLADPLGENPPLAGSLVAGDVDWFAFDVPKGCLDQATGGSRCKVILSTYRRAAAGDADTYLRLYDGCNAAGTPGNLLYANDDYNATTQSEISAADGEGVLLMPGRYYVRVDTGASGTLGPYTLTVGLDCYRLLKRWGDKAPDDHSAYNVEQLISSLGVCANTNDPGLGRWKGTRLQDMQLCVSSWITAMGVAPSFTWNIVMQPTFDQVAAEVGRSEDIVLLLGFYAQGVRCGGHYVTVSGVDVQNRTVTISDPYYNNAEPVPTGNGGPGRVRGPDHANHAPGAPPPPSHDDAQNVSHDRYAVGPGGVNSAWTIPAYATAGATTTCADVANFCMRPNNGQNPKDETEPQTECTAPALPVTVSVEAMVDVSPLQTPLCIRLDTTSAGWPNNLRVDKGTCLNVATTPDAYDVIRGKMCDTQLAGSPPTAVDLGYVRCLYNDVLVDKFDELSPDDDDGFLLWFYLARKTTDVSYGDGRNGAALLPRSPSSGNCP